MKKIITALLFATFCQGSYLPDGYVGGEIVACLCVDMYAPRLPFGHLPAGLQLDECLCIEYAVFVQDGISFLQRRVLKYIFGVPAADFLQKNGSMRRYFVSIRCFITVCLVG